MNSKSGGFFLVVEGPNGAGKSSICSAVAERWKCAGRPVCVISEPSSSPIGDLVRKYRERPEHVVAVACLLAADRYVNQIDYVRREKAKGRLVIADRYLPSTFVYQVLHGLPEKFLEALNTFTDAPDLTVFIDVGLDVLLGRLKDRMSDSFSENADFLPGEVELYGQSNMTPLLSRLGHPSVRIPNEPGKMEVAVDAILRKVEELTGVPL